MSENKEVPKAWEIVSLKEVSAINPRLPYENIEEDLEVSFLPMKNVEEISNIIHLEEQRKYSEVKKGYTPMVDGDVIFAKITPCMENGKIAVVHSLKNGIAFGSTEFHVFRANQAVLNLFLFYFLVQERTRQIAARNMTGAVGQRRVPKQFLETYHLPLPPFPEQHRIVAKIEELFTNLDKGIETLQTTQQQLKIYRQSVLKWAFEGKLTNKDVKEGELPEGWKWQDLKQLCDIRGGATKGRNFKENSTIHLPYLRVANVQDGYLDLKVIKTIEVLETDLERYRLVFGDILYTEGGDRDKLGRGTIWKDEIEDCIHQNHIFRARPISENINSKFISYYSQTQRAKQYFLKHGKQTTNLASINITVLSGLPIPLPEGLEEQNLIVAEIESRLSVCDKIEETISQSLQQAEALRQSILKKAFEGTLVPQDANDEPASVLLERIRAEREVQAKPVKTRKVEVMAERVFEIGEQLTLL